MTDGNRDILSGDDKTDENQRLLVWPAVKDDPVLETGKQIFCNRSLNMKGIVAIGFDMDYTLAQYKPDTFESVAYEKAVRNLVTDFKYPEELLKWEFDWRYMIRGLVLDKHRGNILKMDRYEYVKIAYHGLREMSKEEKVAAYGNTLTRDSFDEPEYSVIDTLFSLAEAYLFAQLVDFKDSNPVKVPDYFQMSKDLRAVVDLCHRDGTLKQMVTQNPSRYIKKDEAIVPMLKLLKDTGRSIFLVTNSLWDYTDIVMRFLCGYNWLEHFQVVVTGSEKPRFFSEEHHASLFEVVPESGVLINTDNGSPLSNVGNSFPRVIENGGVVGCRIYQGGNVSHLHKLFSIESSSQVLYIGDHIYGDILRSKKALGWRTMLVIPELEREVKLVWALKDTRMQHQVWVKELAFVEENIHRLNSSFRMSRKQLEKKRVQSEIEQLESRREDVRKRLKHAQLERHQKFHGAWGQLMKTGCQSSRFAHQVERYACLYTSEVTNLRRYSPDKYFRPNEDFLPHEFGILQI